MAELAGPMEKRKGRWAQLPIMRREGSSLDEDAESFRDAIQVAMRAGPDVLLVTNPFAQDKVEGRGA